MTKTEMKNKLASRLYLMRRFVWLLAIMLATGACKKDENEETVLPSPVDGELRDFPRIGLTSEKLTALKAKTGTPQWTDLVGRMSNSITSGNDEYGFGAFHYATAFAVTSEQKFADRARQIIFRIIEEPGYCDVTSSYLRAPDCTGQVALAADLLFDQLSDTDKNKIFDYLETNAKGIVNLTGWSGWGWQDGNPHFKQLNNYYPGHVQTILHYALLAYNYRDLAREYYSLIVEDELPAAFEMMEAELAGGHGAEGTWYDDKLMGHYAEVVLMLREATDGKIDLGKEYAKVFSDYVKTRLHCLSPIVEENGKPQLYQLPTGDQPAVAGAKVIDLARLRFWLMMDVLKDTPESKSAGYIRYFDQNINFEAKGWQREFNLYYLLHFGQSITPVNYQQDLEQSYFSPGKGIGFYRSSWDNSATTVAIHFSKAHGQRGSHWHFGEGAFYIWYKGWQADHMNRVEGNGVRQNTGLMNTLLINGDENSQGTGDAQVKFFKGSDDFMVMRGDATASYKNKLDKFERTLIATGNVTTVYDRVKKKTAADVVNFVMHNQQGFTTHVTEPNKYTGANGGGRITIKTMSPGGANSVVGKRFRTDFASADSEIHLLHAIETGDVGTSSANMFSVEVTSDAGSFMGVQVSSQNASVVHVVNKTDAVANAISFSAPFGAGNVKLVIVGLSAGNYMIKKDGAQVAQATADASGVIYFETVEGGTFEVKK